jgi:hypothetical protein
MIGALTQEVIVSFFPLPTPFIYKKVTSLWESQKSVATS